VGTPPRKRRLRREAKRKTEGQARGGSQNQMQDFQTLEDPSKDVFWNSSFTVHAQSVASTLIITLQPLASTFHFEHAQMIVLCCAHL